MCWGRKPEGELLLPPAAPVTEKRESLRPACWLAAGGSFMVECVHSLPFSAPEGVKEGVTEGKRLQGRIFV